MGWVLTGRDGAAGGVNIEVYGLLGAIGFEEEELCDDRRGHSLVDLAI